MYSHERDLDVERSKKTLFTKALVAKLGIGALTALEP